MQSSNSSKYWKHIRLNLYLGIQLCSFILFFLISMQIHPLYATKIPLPPKLDEGYTTFGTLDLRLKFALPERKKTYTAKQLEEKLSGDAARGMATHLLRGPHAFEKLGPATQLDVATAVCKEALLRVLSRLPGGEFRPVFKTSILKPWWREIPRVDPASVEVIATPPPEMDSTSSDDRIQRRSCVQKVIEEEVAPKKKINAVAFVRKRYHLQDVLEELIAYDGPIEKVPHSTIVARRVPASKKYRNVYSLWARHQMSPEEIRSLHRFGYDTKTIALIISEVRKQFEAALPLTIEELRAEIDALQDVPAFETSLD